MRNLSTGLLLAGFLLCIYACSTSNVGQIPAPTVDNHEAAFVVNPAEGLGTFDAVLDVTEQANGTTVTISAENASDLAAANFELRYDADRFSPVSVETGEFLGSADETINLTKTDLSGVVPIGIAQLPGTAAVPVNGSGLLAVVHFANLPFSGARNASASPVGNQNAVDDLKIIGQSDTSVTLKWTEKNVGDYDNNSEVNVGDLTQIALLFGQTEAAAPDPGWFALVDGDGNGEINTADIQPIAVNYGNKVVGYTVYTDTEGLENIGSGCTCERSQFFIDAKKAVEYTYEAPHNPAAMAIFTVRPVDHASADNPGEISNVAESVDDPGAPNPPTNVVAESGDTFGDFNIHLSWTKSEFDQQYDVASYVIERKLGSDNTWVELVTVGGDADEYTNHDTSFLDEIYDYRIKAVDFTALESDWSNVASATPYFPPLPPTPTGVMAEPDPAKGSAVLISWVEPVGTDVNGYKLYWREQGDPDFELLIWIHAASTTQYSHTQLQQGVTYEYYVTNMAGSTESLPSSTVSTLCSEEGAVDIVSFETDKTTHYKDGGDGTPATITIVTDPPADTYEWSSTLGSVNGTGDSVTWTPPGGSDAGVVTISCTAKKGTGEATAELSMFLTSETIKTQYGINGVYVDFDNLPSDVVPNEPYRPFSYYIENQEHAVIFNDWGLW